MLEIKSLNVNDRFTIKSPLPGHQHHKKAVYRVAKIYDGSTGARFSISCQNLNDTDKKDPQLTTFSDVNFSVLGVFAERVDAPAEVA